MAEIDDATIAQLRELCDRARAEAERSGYDYDEAYLLEIGELSVTVLPALLEERSIGWCGENARVREELDAARKALREIADYRKLSSVDIADPPEDQARDWANAAKRCWDRARAALEART